METTRNPLSPFAMNFFTDLKNYLECPLYFFGSIQRPDYFEKGSDIDVDIFVLNETNTLLKLQNYFKVQRKDFKRILWNVCDNKGDNTKLVNGYKLMYKKMDAPFTEKAPFVVEFSIYNEKWKLDVLREHCKKMEIPTYAAFILIILKFCFYTLAIIPSEYYIMIKRYILNTLVGQKEEYFVVLDYKK
jgi:hypothetical protein